MAPFCLYDDKGAIPCEAMLPAAHVGHYLWVLYLPPILIVIGSIVRNAYCERRGGEDEDR
jgi:hypothetical protein